MANDLERAAAFLAEHGDTAGATFKASVRLVRGLTPLAEGREVPVIEVFTGIPEADRAIAESAGVAAIAGEEGVAVDDVIAFTKLLLAVGLAFV